MNKKKMTPVWITFAIVVIGAAILDQLRQPPEQRTWQGHIVGVPYVLRLPTIERVREKVWNKSTSRILMPHLFGVGWSLNFYPLMHPNTLQKQD